MNFCNRKLLKTIEQLSIYPWHYPFPDSTRIPGNKEEVALLRLLDTENPFVL
jgi:hypothetical protein